LALKLAYADFEHPTPIRQVSFMQRSPHSPSQLIYLVKHPLLLLCLVVSCLGIFFRFYNVDKKVVWHDEAYTAIVVSGYERGEIRQDLIRSLGLSAEAVQQYQAIDPESTWKDTLISVADEEPQNSPLYFLLSRFWVQITQSPVVLGMRSLSVWIGLLVLPATFWLCWELFQSIPLAWLGTALVSISPIHVIYAQEARQYSLLTVVAIVASALLLRALRQKTPRSLLGCWALYALTCAIGLYTQPFFLFVMVGHGVYILIQAVKQLLPLKTLILYSAASLLSMLSYMPWLYIILNDLDAISGWRGDTELSLLALIGRWLLNLSRIFADFDFAPAQAFDLSFSLSNPLLYLVIGLTVLVGYSFYFLIRNTPLQVWLFIVTLTVFPTIFLAIADLVETGVRSTVPRYILPSFLGIQLAVTALFGAKLFGTNLRTNQQRLWQGAIALLFTLSCLSCLQMSQSSTGWSKYSDYFDAEVSSLINAYEAPAVMAHGVIRLVSLNYSLRDDALLQLSDGKALTRLPIPERENIFLYDLEVYTRPLVQRIRRQYGFDAELLYDQPLGFIHTNLQIWKVIPIRSEALIQSFEEIDPREQ